MIKIRRNCKEIERKSFGAKTGQKQGKNKGKTGVCEISQPLRNRNFAAKPVRNPIALSAKIFAAAKPILAHECHFAAQEPPFRGCEPSKHEILHFAGKAPFRRGFRSCEAIFWHTSAISQHSDHHFAAVKWLRSIKNSQFRSQNPISQGVL